MVTRAAELRRTKLWRRCYRLFSAKAPPRSFFLVLTFAIRLCPKPEQQPALDLCLQPILPSVMPPRRWFNRQYSQKLFAATFAYANSNGHSENVLSELNQALRAAWSAGQNSPPGYIADDEVHRGLLRSILEALDRLSEELKRITQKENYTPQELDTAMVSLKIQTFVPWAYRLAQTTG